jgi:hypothetical protein
MLVPRGVNGWLGTVNGYGGLVTAGDGDGDRTGTGNRASTEVLFPVPSSQSQFPALFPISDVFRRYHQDLELTAKAR